MIGLIVAMNDEANLVKKNMQNCREEKHGRTTFSLGTINNKEVVLITCGIGKVAAAVGCVELIQAYKPECIINSGIAGGVSENVHQGDIVVSQHISYHDVWCGTGNGIGQIQGLPAKFEAYKKIVDKIDIRHRNNMHLGLICSGDQFITTREEVLEIRRNFPEALAVDMESGAIAQTCYLYNIPFLCCRLISDTPASTNNHQEQYKNFWETAPDRSFEFLISLMNTL